MPDVVIVGGGLAGLACARRLRQKGVAFVLLEKDAELGGRVRTDDFEGFRLDRGFQVLLTAYPEARRVLDYASLDLRPFQPGALVRLAGRFERLGDPWRSPSTLVSTLRSRVGSLHDKWRIAALRREVGRGSLAQLFQRPEATTLDRLRAFGFSQTIIDALFRPFFGGILLDRDLRASSLMFDFVFRMLSLGDTVLPADGMEAIPRQLASTLDPASLRTGTAVRSVEPGRVHLESGDTLEAKAVVVATEGPEACRLTGALPPPGSRAVTCLYFAAPEPPVRVPILVLDGEGRGPVNNLCVPSLVSPRYAPAGQSLVSATVIGDPELREDELVAAVRSQLGGWFGVPVSAWRHLRTYRIRHAQPAQPPPLLATPERPVRLRQGLYACGDHRDTASIQGALVSGRRAADAVLAQLGVSHDPAGSSARVA